MTRQLAPAPRGGQRDLQDATSGRPAGVLEMWKAAVSAQADQAVAWDDERERRSRPLLPDEWSSLRVPRPTAASLPVWTIRSSAARGPQLRNRAIAMRQRQQSINRRPGCRFRASDRWVWAHAVPLLINLRRVVRRALARVLAWVIDVCVESVLMAGVPDGAEPHAEVAAAQAAQVADGESWRASMRPVVLARDVEQRPHQPIGPPAAPGPIRGAAQHGVPGDEAWALRRQLYAPHEAAG